WRAASTWRRRPGVQPRSPRRRFATGSPPSARATARSTSSTWRRAVKLSELGEVGLLAELERRGLARRIENDAAELPGGLVVTQDALVQDVHFRLDRISWRDLGFRAAAVNLSDLAASGATPDGLIVTLALPAATEVDDVLDLYAGIAETGVPVVGGDTTAAAQVVLSVTALGHSVRVPGRAGARPGD